MGFESWVVVGAGIEIGVGSGEFLDGGRNRALNEKELGHADSTDFKSKKIRVPLNQPMKAEQKQESNEVLASVEEDRTYVYQATVVRIMKSRKVRLVWVG